MHQAVVDSEERMIAMIMVIKAGRKIAMAIEMNEKV